MAAMAGSSGLNISMKTAAIGRAVDNNLAPCSSLGPHPDSQTFSMAPANDPNAEAKLLATVAPSTPPSLS